MAIKQLRQRPYVETSLVSVLKCHMKANCVVLQNGRGDRYQLIVQIMSVVVFQGIDYRVDASAQ